MPCAKCGSTEDVESVQVSPGRDYSGPGGGPRPPEYADLCGDCREERAEKERSAMEAERRAERLAEEEDL